MLHCIMFTPLHSSIKIYIQQPSPAVSPNFSAASHKKSRARWETWHLTVYTTWFKVKGLLYNVQDFAQIKHSQ